MTEIEAYACAGTIIKIAMGRKIVGRGRNRRLAWNAEEDPLAMVCGIEAILDLIDKTKGKSNARL